MPKVSICIPAYNYADYLKDAIASALSQTFDDFELLIVDNCSTDGTRDVAEHYRRRDGRIVYHCNEANIGLVGNLNRCLELATGEYIKFLCADDLLLPTCLERMVEVLDRNPDVSLVTAARRMVTGTLKPIRRLAYSYRDIHIPGTEAINRCLFNGNQIGEPTAVMFRRQAAAGGFQTAYSQLVDLDMWFRLLEQGDLVSLSEELCVFRQHDEQGTKVNLRSLNFLNDEERLYHAYISKPYIHASQVNIFNWKFIMAWNIWKQRKYCNDPALVRKHIERYMNQNLFFLLMLPAMGTKKLLKIRARVSALFKQ